MAKPTSTVKVFGIRHHGPGSARYLLQALDAYRPDMILIEGPADGQPLLDYIGNDELVPPVAMMLHRPDGSETHRSAIYPFAEWSPEWQALQFGHKQAVPCRLIDLPQGLYMAVQEQLTATEAGNQLSVDPLQTLAEAAGYEDGERWWDQLIEQHTADDAVQVFAEINQAMKVVRENSPITPLTELREAHMRLEIRKAQKEAAKIAVVCGAWHGPVLNPADFPSQKEDRERLKGIKKVKVRATWVPWSHERLAMASGYGAGIRYPRWYQHLWHQPETPERGWLTQVARLLRDEQLDASTAQVIDAVRLATYLSGMRGYTHPTIDELHDAALATFCNGDLAPLMLIDQKLYVGQQFGEIPKTVPMVPLQQDFEATAKRVRLKRPADTTQLRLDLRKPLHLERSQLLHRLRLLDIGFGTPSQSSRSQGTFKEEWSLRWEADHLIVLIERSVWGSTVETAASDYVTHRTKQIDDLAVLSELMIATLPAALPHGIEAIAKRLEEVATLAGSIPEMMQALPPLVNALAYGDVRNTAAELIQPVVDAIVPRITIGLLPAVNGLDRKGSETFIPLLNGVHRAIRMLEQRSFQDDWMNVLQQLAAAKLANGLLSGRAVRLLFDSDSLEIDAVAQQLNQITSQATEPDEVVDWLDGFLEGSGLVLVHHIPLLTLIDQWLSQLPEPQFMRLLPLIRRAFSRFTTGERFQIGQILKQPNKGAESQADGSNRADWLAQLDQERANLVLPSLIELLGVKNEIKN